MTITRTASGAIFGSAIKSGSFYGIGDLDKFMDWQVAQAGGASLTTQTAFERVPYIYRCVMLRAHAVSALPFVIENKRGDIIEETPYTAAIPAWMAQTEAALALTGAAYWYKVRNRARVVKQLQWFAPQTIEVLQDAQQGLTGFRRTVNGHKQDYTPDDIVHCWLPNPLGEVGPGPSPLDAAMTAAGLSKAELDYAGAFFERGAIPAVILTVEGNVSQPELERLETWWKKLLQGVRRAWETVAVRASIKPVIVGQPVKDLAMTELDAIVRLAVCIAMGVRPSMLEMSANFATAKEDRLSFYQETILPEAELIVDALNAQFLAPQGYTLRLTPDQMDIMQEDEAARAQSLANLRQAGLDLVTALEVLGFDLTDEQWERVKAEEERKRQELAAQQQVQQAAPVVESQPVERTDGTTRLPAEHTLNEPTTVKFDPNQARVPDAKAILDDLRLWRDKAKKRGKMCAFESDAIPPGIAQAVTMLGLPSFAALKQLDADDMLAAEEELLAAIRAALRSQWAIAAAAIAAGGAWDDIAFAAAMTAAIDSVLVNIVLGSALRHAVSVGIDFDPAVINHAAWEWARSYSYDLVSKLTDTTRKVVQDAVAKFISTPGMTNADLRALLSPAFGDVRAEMIATTEVTRAFSQGTREYQAQLAEMGIDMERVWRASADERVCPSCAPLDGKPEGEWPAEVQDGPPAHPRCRCWTTLRLARARRPEQTP